VSNSFPFDEKLYRHLVKKVGSLSSLFSNNDKPLIDSRIAEKLFELASNGRSIARSDEAFDVIAGDLKDIGVGVKTFIFKGSAFEKVQEFTKMASRGELNLNGADLVKAIVRARNNKIENAKRENNLRESGHIYHCLVRTSGAAFIHEEPYESIKWNDVVPINRNGNHLDNYIEDTKGVRFTDGIHVYNFSKAKNVLFKQFAVTLPDPAELIPIEIDLKIWEKLAEGLQMISFDKDGNYSSDVDELVAGKDFVVLPLYSPRSGKVEKASGINQWNANGRKRKFGEAYIPIPAEVHRLASGFFPAIDTPFDLYLPNSDEPVSAKVCQAGGKALMSNPNPVLCKWLYRVIDKDLTDESFERTPNREPYTYEDLLKIGVDSVKVIKVPRKSNTYAISFCEIGSYNDFVDSFDI
jgi:hypothetical protein